MKLLTREILDAFVKQGDISDKDPADITVIAKFFNPCGSQVWYAADFIPALSMFTGFVSLFGDHTDECGSFSLNELLAVEGHFGLGIERDLDFPIGKYTLKQIMDGERP